MRRLFPNPNYIPQNVNKVLLVVCRQVLFPFIEPRLARRRGLVASVLSRLIRLTYLRANPKDPRDAVNEFVRYCYQLGQSPTLYLLTDLDTKATSVLTSIISNKRAKTFKRQGLMGVLGHRGCISDLKHENYDIVAIVYQDAIGLGCLDLDLLALRVRPRYVVSVTGRRRAFTITSATLARLLVLRLADKLWLAQLSALPLLTMSIMIWLLSEMRGKVCRLLANIWHLRRPIRTPKA